MSVRPKEVLIATPGGEQKTAVWWIADYKDKSGRRHQVRFKRKGDAVAHEEASKVAIRAGQYVSVDPNRTIADAAEGWLARVEADGMRGKGKLERATMRQYRQHVDHHITPHIEGKLAKLTAKDVEIFRNKLLGLDDEGKQAKDKDGKSVKPPMSRAMARKVMTSFKSILKAAKVGHLAADVSIGVSDREKRQLKIGRDIPMPAEIKRLIDAAKAKDDPKLHALLLTAIFTGLRASELRGLPWGDVDFDASELHVRQRADRYNALGSPKSKHGTRTIPLPPDLLTALKVWKLACPKKGDEDFVFQTNTGAIEHHKNMLRGLVPVMKAAGLAKGGKSKYALHALRHFFASWCINPKESGGRQLTPKVVQTLMGHSSIMITLDIYGHLFPSGSDRSELEASSRALLG
jgi:integrase